MIAYSIKTVPTAGMITLRGVAEDASVPFRLVRITINRFGFATYEYQRQSIVMTLSVRVEEERTSDERSIWEIHDIVTTVEKTDFESKLLPDIVRALAYWPRVWNDNIGQPSLLLGQ